MKIENGHSCSVQSCTEALCSVVGCVPNSYYEVI